MPAALALAALATLTLACASPGGVQYTSGRRAEVTPDGLHRIQTWGSMASRVYVRPEVDLHPYDKLILDPVVIRFALGSTRELAPQDVRRVEASFDEAFRGQLAKSAVYTLVTQPGSDVLRLTPELGDVVVTAPAQPATPDADVYVKQSGAVTLALVLSDSLSRTVLVRAYDRQTVGGPTDLAFRATPGANLANAKLVFQQWALRLRSGLDEVRALPPLRVEESATPEPL
jgi:hypothetical protein